MIDAPPLPTLVLRSNGQERIIGITLPIRICHSTSQGEPEGTDIQPSLTKQIS